MGSTLLANILTLIVSQAVAATPTAVAVPQWSTHEIMLTASGQYTNPAVAVDLLGVFSGPDGQAIIVKGFWDGGQTFRVRFTPTQRGVWTFTTVSDDPGLDAHAGTITCVSADQRSRGFVRQQGDGPGAWVYDDGPAARVEPTTISVRERGADCGADGPCAESVGPLRLDVDLSVLRTVDQRVANAFAAGRLVQLTLFDANDADTMDQTRMYRDIAYMTARYAAFPNVIWCMHAAAANDGPQAFWRTARRVVMSLDPYFTQLSRERVLRNVCPAAIAADGTTAR